MFGFFIFCGIFVVVVVVVVVVVFVVELFIEQARSSN